MGELIYSIGKLLIDYEKTFNGSDENKSTKLLKTKEVIEMYPALSLYSINKAVREEKLPVIKIGNLNFFTREDIEKFLKIQKLKSDNNKWVS